MFRAILNATSGGTRPPPSLERIAIDRHPDGALLRLCASLARMRDAQQQLEDAIAGAEAELRRTPAVTIDGRRLKELAL